MKHFAFLSIAFAIAACGGGDHPKGKDAKDKGTMSGSKAQGMKSMGSSKGAVYDGVTCDSSAEGIAWCDDDYTIVFCSDSTWWALDCADVGYDVCDYDGDYVDCY